MRGCYAAGLPADFRGWQSASNFQIGESALLCRRARVNRHPPLPHGLGRGGSRVVIVDRRHPPLPHESGRGGFRVVILDRRHPQLPHESGRGGFRVVIVDREQTVSFYADQGSSRLMISASDLRERGFAEEEGEILDRAPDASGILIFQATCYYSFIFFAGICDGAPRRGSSRRCAFQGGRYDGSVSSQMSQMRKRHLYR